MIPLLSASVPASQTSVNIFAIVAVALTAVLFVTVILILFWRDVGIKARDFELSDSLDQGGTK